MNRMEQSINSAGRKVYVIKHACYVDSLQRTIKNMQKSKSTSVCLHGGKDVCKLKRTFYNVEAPPCKCRCTFYSVASRLPLR